MEDRRVRGPESERPAATPWHRDPIDWMRWANHHGATESLGTKTMRKLMPSLALAAVPLLACERAGTAPLPSFEALFPSVEGDLMTTSSPGLADLTGDGVPDIVFGNGVDRVQPADGGYVFAQEPDPPGEVIAVSGATNEVLWAVPHPGDAFTTPRFTDLNGDSVPDVVMGGREGAFSALSGASGEVLWRLSPTEVAGTPVPYNFFTPAPIADANGDGVAELLVVYGGDATKQPGEPRAPGYLVVVSGADGTPIAVHETPDGGESYASTVVYERPDGSEWVVFGTGGEADGGTAYRAPVASLVDGSFAQRAEQLVDPGTKGVIAPATMVELTGDEELDVVLSTFDGRLIAVDGSTREVLWEQNAEGEETYHPAAVLRIQRDGRLGLLVSRGVGVFPRYAGTVHRLYDAASGRILYEHRDANHPAGAPLGVDLDGDGIDEPFFFSMRYPTTQGARIHILHAPSRSLITHDLPANFATTPLIADPRGTGTLELIGLSWRIASTDAAPDWRTLTWQLLRLALDARTPAFSSWAAYMGTASDGHYAAPAAANRQ